MKTLRSSYHSKFILKLLLKFLLIFSFIIIIFLSASCVKKTVGYTVIKSEPIIISENNIDPKVYFCPRDNCSSILIDTINSAKTYVYCALYDLDLPDLIETYENLNPSVDLKLVIDNDNKLDADYDFVVYDTSSQLSHNKFCVIDDEIVTTGSFNPTINGDTKNNNNFLVLHSKYLARNYKSEFEELWNRIYGKGNKNIYPNIYLNDYLIENYFCPDDDCEEHVLSTIKKANSSIYFLIFSFTSDPVGDIIIQKASQGIEVAGVFEKTQNNAYNEYSKMEQENLNVSWDTKNTKGKLHHKYFIIDKKIVITGSYNPTASGDSKNDENILIIHNANIANRFLEEFYMVSK